MLTKLQKQLFIIGLLFLLPLYAIAPNVPPQVSVKVASAMENEPISGEIAIVHLPSEIVDESSFKIADLPLPVTHLGDGFSQGEVVSRYGFRLAGKPRGLYLLPEIRVQVGSNSLSAPQVTFEVIAGQASNELLLEAKASATGPVYPGQKVTFQYLIYFRNPIQLTKEVLPLLSVPGFRTIGAPKIETVPQGDVTVQVISQIAAAETPGTYNSGPSLIQGYIYSQDDNGNRTTASQLLQAQAPSVQVTVQPFPEENRPASFNGALGNFYWRVTPVGSTNVQVGDKISLQVSVTGSGDFDTVVFPDLGRQPGFKSSFLLSDIPPVGETKEAEKVFVVDLRPLTTQVKTVPAIEFSSFDSISKNYVIRKSDPIAITVRPGAGGQQNAGGKNPLVAPIDIIGSVRLSYSELQASHFQDILLVYAAIFLFAVLAAEKMLHMLAEKSKNKPRSSRDILLEAFKNKANPDECCRLIRKALLQRLFEVEITSKELDSPEELATTGIEGEIRSLLMSIEQKRFMGLQTHMEIGGIIDEASQLFYRLK